ncbi:MAG: haloalkane dehalogenase [Myxococcota bacterium]
MFVCMTACGCDRNGGTDGAAEAIERACDADPEIITTADGVEFVRTPDSCFESLVDWPHEPQYVEIDGLRQAYVDEGPADGPVVLLLHGQPSWSYLYRKMIPVLTEAGYRAIAMDHLGTGRSDKPTDIASYSYLGHYDRLLRFIDALGLEDITLFGQDWGGVFGLRAAGLNPSRFARIAIGDSRLRDIPAGTQLYPPVENPNESADITPLFARIPAQQFPFYIGCERRFPFVDRFEDWMIYAMRAESFHPSEVLEASTWFDLPEDAEAAYDAPFPSRIYMAGVRTFPSLINEQAGVNADARAGLIAFERPFVTLWAANDPGGLGTCEVQDDLICNVPGAAGQPHARLPEASHFLQDDQGPEIARRLVAFIQNDPSVLGNHEAVCAEAVASKADLPRAHQSPGLPPAECPVDTPNCGDPATYEAHADASAARTGDFQSSALDPVADGSAMMSSSGAVPVPGVGVGGGVLLTGLLAGLAYRIALRRAARQPTRF